MDRSQWQPKRRLELQYQKSLAQIGRSMLADIEGLTDPFEITKVIRGWLTNRIFQHFANETAQTVVGGLARTSARTWREVAREQSNGRAIYEALRRELTGPIGAAVDFEIKRNAELIRSVPLDIANDMVKYIEAESFKGRRASAIAEDILAKFPDVTRNKAKLIARTETSKTSTALTQARSESLGIPAYIWRTSEDSRVRKSHDHLDNVIVFWRDPPAPEALIGIKSTLGKYHAGCCPNCFPGSTNVNLSNGCNKLWRRWYSGDVVVLRLSNGAIVEATPNHPILTSKGWLAINEVQKGDYLFEAFSNSGHIIKENHNEFITSFKDLFDSLSRFCSIETTLGSEFDFHGDGSKNNVDVIDTDSLLTNYLVSDFFKSFTKFNFSGANSNNSSIIFERDSSFGEAFNRIFTTQCIISLRDNFFSFLNSKFAHSGKVSLTSVSSGNSVISENSCDSSAGTIIGLREGQLAFSPDIPRDYFLLWQAILPDIMKIFGQYNTPTSKMLLQSLILAPDFLTNGFHGGSFHYSPCAVVDKFVGKFTGHVYNLQNNYSWYSITHNLVVHNCRCYSAPIINLDYISWPHDVYRSGSITKMTRHEFERIT